MLPQLVRITSQIRVLARWGRISCARKLFDEMPHRDTVAWNAMLSSYSQLGLHQEALSLFQYMRNSEIKADNFSFTAILSACAGSCELHYGQKVHAQVIVLGYNSSVPVNNSLIDMYGKCLTPSRANRVFEEMGIRNEVSWCSMLFAYTNANQFDIARGVFDKMLNRVDIAWNTMIAGYAQCGEIELCFDLFKEMLESCCGPDQCTLSALMNVCTESQEYFVGCLIHAFVVKSGWSSAVEANNSILSFYANLGCRDDIAKVYESIETLSEVSWNAMVDARMKLGDIHEAFLVFQQAPEKNIVSWTSMITGYARNGLEEQALNFFVDVIRDGLRPDDFTFGAVLHACSNLTVLEHGRMVHGCVIHYGFHAYTYVGNALVNMYAKCGDIEGSNQAFIGILDKDLLSWNALLFAFGLHGQASQALRIYDEMGARGIKPDKVSFIGLLMTCSHSGLIEEGRVIFKSMSLVHGLSPGMDHVACMVDMLGRGGYLEEARDLARKYPGTGRASISSREALFGACSTHGDVAMGAKLGEDLNLLEPRNEMSYVLLSNLYCASGQWKEAEGVRKAMADRGVIKTPGCSWIEVKNKVIAFVAGRDSHPHIEELHEMLRFLEHEMRNPNSLVVRMESFHSS
ncbi:pentatricopeptide repeat-containing protein At2g36980, mitochondrial [Actinidia eriantha]|uniref:pentatricopeptide repeat-containing protein At2g36980, mitochondrial n=1 Tax=Actinidia eriantha TaxID=165200 RepID=UPI0025866A0F|nr:pentatricopeptide repeat-containing protein At2g36980, mitochondrial [Actinidia eriantha]